MTGLSFAARMPCPPNHLLLLSNVNSHIVPFPLSIVATLLRQCTGQYQSRVLAKFTENEHEKVDRLVELHFRYHERVTRANAKIESFRQVGGASGIAFQLGWRCFIHALSNAKY